jgi:ferrous iron transport protein A
MHTPTLERSALGQHRVVSAVLVPPDSPQWARWLDEIGFIPGEHVVVTARAALGGA